MQQRIPARTFLVVILCIDFGIGTKDGVGPENEINARRRPLDLAENLLLKQQLLVTCRPRQRAPNLLPADRFLSGFFSLFLRPRRIVKTAVGVRPSTLLRFHDYLVHCKYRALFSPNVTTRRAGVTALPG